MNLLIVLHAEDSWERCSIPVEGTPQPQHTLLVTSRQPTPPQLQRAYGMSSTLPHRGCGVALLLFLWKHKWKMEFFKHLVLWLLLILGRGGGSLLYRAGAGTQNKLCVLHTQVALTVLLRETVVDALSQSQQRVWR